jgi:hypothetical protein
MSTWRIVYETDNHDCKYLKHELYCNHIDGAEKCNRNTCPIKIEQQ